MVKLFNQVVKSAYPVGLIFLMFFYQSQTIAQINVSKYQADNKRILAGNEQIEVVIIGDSITEKWVQNRPHIFKKNGWIGRGIVGETSEQILARFDNDVLQLKPKMVVIIAGTNDVAGNGGSYSVNKTLYNLLSMVELACKNSIVPIVGRVIPATNFFWSPNVNPKKLIPELNTKIDKLAMEHSFSTVNFFSVMANKEKGLRDSLSEDGSHPNLWGYIAMESVLEETLDNITNISSCIHK